MNGNFCNFQQCNQPPHLILAWRSLSLKTILCCVTTKIKFSYFFTYLQFLSLIRNQFECKRRQFQLRWFIQSDPAKSFLACKLTCSIRYGVLMLSWNASTYYVKCTSVNAPLNKQGRVLKGFNPNWEKNAATINSNWIWNAQSFVNISNIPIKVERTKMFGFKCTKMCPPWHRQSFIFFNNKNPKYFRKEDLYFWNWRRFRKKTSSPNDVIATITIVGVVKRHFDVARRPDSETCSDSNLN